MSDEKTNEGETAETKEEETAWLNRLRVEKQARLRLVKVKSAEFRYRMDEAGRRANAEDYNNAAYWLHLAKDSLGDLENECWKIASAQRDIKRLGGEP